MTTDSWRTNAACLGGDTAVWFPPQNEPDWPNPIELPDWETPRLTCQTCPVQTECYESNRQAENPRDRDTFHGMHAGLTPDERWHIRNPPPIPADNNGVVVKPAAGSPDVRPDPTFHDLLDRL